MSNDLISCFDALIPTAYYVKVCAKIPQNAEIMYGVANTIVYAIMA